MVNEGFLDIRAYTSDAIIPIQDATVIVSLENSGGKRALTAVSITDDAGLSRVLVFPAPDIENSLSPDGKSPFREVIIEAGHPDYGKIRVNNAQIFPTITSEQDIMFRPLNDNPNSRNKWEVFDVTSQAL